MASSKIKLENRSQYVVAGGGIAGVTCAEQVHAYAHMYVYTQYTVKLYYIDRN